MGDCTMITLGLCVFTGELQEGGAFLLSDPNGGEAIKQIVCFACLLFIGLKLVLLIVREYGAVMAVTVTSARRALTLGLSFFVYPKPFIPHLHGIGAVAVAGSVIVMTAQKLKWQSQE